MKLKQLMKVIFGEDMKFVEVKITGTESMLKADGEDFVVGQPVYLVEPGKDPVIIDSEAEFILEDGRKIETGSDGMVIEISTESIEDAIETPAEEEMAECKTEEKMAETPEAPVQGDEKPSHADEMKKINDRIDALTSSIESIMKSLPENMMEEMEKIKKEIKMIKNEPIAEKFDSEPISNTSKSGDFKDYLINLQKNIN